MPPNFLAEATTPRETLINHSKYLRAMGGQKLVFGQCGIVRKVQNLTLVGAEIFSDGSLRKFGLEARRKEKARTVVECNEPPIKCCIVQA